MYHVFKALNFAAQCHSGQRRKDESKSPYINHPIMVVELLSSCGVTDIDTLAAAALHDTIEDTGVKREDLETQFGSKIASIVVECSDDKMLDKVTRKKQQLAHAAAASVEARMVKIADKCANLLDASPVIWNDTELRGYRMWSFAVVEEALRTSRLSLVRSPIFVTMDKRATALFVHLGINVQMTPEELQHELDTYYQYLQNQIQQQSINV